MDRVHEGELLMIGTIATGCMKELAVKEVAIKYNDILPKAFNELPEAKKGINVDTPVSTKKFEESNGMVSIITRNESLEGDVHPITGVPFEKKIIETSPPIEGVFPNFKSEFDVQLPENLYKETDRQQFKECNQQLKDEVSKNPDLESGFNKVQLEQIENGDTPDGFVWHHDAEPGRMQLVDFETHANTGHTGGKTVWGGGNENR